jgi:hypothetical protein
MTFTHSTPVTYLNRIAFRPRYECKTTTGGRCAPQSLLWGRRESNPHGFLHVILSHARLPIPTLPRFKVFILYRLPSVLASRHRPQRLTPLAARTRVQISQMMFKSSMTLLQKGRFHHGDTENTETGRLLAVSSQCFGERTPPRRGLEQVSPSY